MDDPEPRLDEIDDFYERESRRKRWMVWLLLILSVLFGFLFTCLHD